MTLTEKTALLADVIEIEPELLKPDTELESLELWDSLAKLSLIAMFTEDFGRSIDIAQVRKFRTANDIYEQMEKVEA